MFTLGKRTDSYDEAKFFTVFTYNLRNSFCDDWNLFLHTCRAMQIENVLLSVFLGLRLYVLVNNF